jgi:hypothetical protein
MVTVNHRPDNCIRLIYTSCHRKTVRFAVQHTEGYAPTKRSICSTLKSGKSNPTYSGKTANSDKATTDSDHAKCEASFTLKHHEVTTYRNAIVITRCFQLLKHLKTLHRVGPCLSDNWNTCSRRWSSTLLNRHSRWLRSSNNSIELYSYLNSVKIASVRRDQLWPLAQKPINVINWTLILSQLGLAR